MLDAGTHIVLLNASDIGTGSLSCHHGILRVILEVTTAEGVTHDVQGRSQQHVGTILLHLLTDGLSYLFDQLGVPGRGEQRTNGEMGAVVSGGVTLTGSVDTEPGRTVSQYDSRDAERVEGIGGTSGTGYETLGGTNHGIVATEASHTNTNHEVGLVLE